MESAPERPSLRNGQIVALLMSVLAVLAFFLLQGEPHDGRVTVRVDPAGAKVRLLEPTPEAGRTEKSAAIGKVTFEGLPRGATARVLVRAKGYKDGLGSAQIPEEGGEAIITVHLEKEAGQLEVTTEPPDALVFLDNRAAGMAPQLLQNVGPGEHLVSARKTGFEPKSESIRVGANESKKVHIVLTPLPQEADAGVAEEEPEEAPPEGYGRVVLKSTHNATFSVDNQLAGVGLKLIRNVRAGPHLIGCRAHKRGFDTRRIEVINQETTVVNFEFLEDPVERAKKATDPNEPIYWVSKGGSTRNSGRYGDAADMFKKALELDPDFYPAHRQLGYTLPPLKKWDEAIHHMERYLELNPHAADKEFAEEMIGVYEQYRSAEAKGESSPDIRWEGVGFRREQ